MKNISEQQIGRGPLENCSRCGAALVKYVDFDGDSPTSDVCHNCRHTDPTNESVTSDLESTFKFESATGAPYKPKEEQQPPDKEIMFRSDGTYSSDIVQVQYGFKPQDINQYMKIHPLIRQSLPKPILVETKPDSDIVERNSTTIKQKKHKGKIIVDWSKVIGYEEIKHIIDAALNSTHKKKTHILLCGAPGTSKTVFLLTIQESLKNQGLNAHYLDATTLTSSGVIEYMFTHDMEFCLLDELDKLAKEHQATFLNTLETGILQETKHKKIRSKSMKDVTFIITANYQEKILPPLFTRMLTLLIPEYTKEQFYKIGVQLLMEQYNKTQEIASYIVDNIYRIYTEERKEKPNLRYARDVAILTDNDKANIDPILKGITTYSKRYEE